MSFAHYFERTERELEPAVFERIGHNLKVLFAASPVAISGGYGEVGTPPSVSGELVFFNGAGTKETGAYEDFVLEREPSQTWNCCATGGISGEPKPYDLVVMAALIVADNVAPGAWEITSDGWDFEWYRARDFVNEVLPGGYELPASIAANHGLPMQHYAEARAAWERSEEGPAGTWERAS